MSTNGETNVIQNETCDNCEEKPFHYYCEDCSEYLCIECNGDIHKTGKKSRHTRGEVYKRNKILKATEYCMNHRDEELCWFCKTCNYSVCNHCIDDGHKNHDFILSIKMAASLLTQAKDAVGQVMSLIPKTYEALNHLEVLQYDLGAKDVLTFEKANITGTKHVTNREMAISIINDHFHQIEKYNLECRNKTLKALEEYIDEKSNM